MAGGVHGGDAWQGLCIGGVCVARGGACMTGGCGRGGHAWQERSRW